MVGRLWSVEKLSDNSTVRMRQKRAKSYRKQMLVYNHTFKFREPYQALVDDELVMDCFESKYDLSKGLKRTLQAEVKVMITQCCMQALYTTGNQGAIEMAKWFERRRCNHPPKEAKSPLECIESVVNINGRNKHRYVVASQNIDIRRKLRKVPGVPLVHMSRAVMIMEPLSDTSVRLSKKLEHDKLYKGLNDPKYTGLEQDDEVKESDNPKEKDAKPEEPKKSRKRGPKQPNPLSIKKRKVSENKEVEEKNSDCEGKKRRRRHRANAKAGAGTDTSSIAVPQDVSEE